MINQASSCDLKELVQKFIPEGIGREIEKATAGIYPLQNVFIRKVKILKAPKFDLMKLMEVCHSHTAFLPHFGDDSVFVYVLLIICYLNSLLIFPSSVFRFMRSMKT